MIYGAQPPEEKCKCVCGERREGVGSERKSENEGKEGRIELVGTLIGCPWSSHKVKTKVISQKRRY